MPLLSQGRRLLQAGGQEECQAQQPSRLFLAQQGAAHPWFPSAGYRPSSARSRSEEWQGASWNAAERVAQARVGDTHVQALRARSENTHATVVFCARYCRRLLELVAGCSSGCLRARRRGPCHRGPPQRSRRRNRSCHFCRQLGDGLCALAWLGAELRGQLDAGNRPCSGFLAAAHCSTHGHNIPCHGEDNRGTHKRVSALRLRGQMACKTATGHVRFWADSCHPLQTEAVQEWQVRLTMSRGYSTGSPRSRSCCGSVRFTTLSQTTCRNRRPLAVSTSACT